MVLMSHRNRLHPPLLSEPVRRIEAGPWAIELLPGCAYATRYVATQAGIGFAFDSQRGLHAIGSDRVQPSMPCPTAWRSFRSGVTCCPNRPREVNICG